MQMRQAHRLSMLLPLALWACNCSPAKKPGAPTDVVGTAGDGQVSLTWTAPTSTGGTTGSTATKAITTYTVTASPGGAKSQATGVTELTFTGLTNGTGYTFTVHATNSAGDGPESTPSATITPMAAVTVPGAPASASATGGKLSATVTWTAPTSTGGSAITSYSVTPRSGGTASTATMVTSGLSTTITGLIAGSYTFDVAAINAKGTGPATTTASVTVAPATVPDAPTNVVAVASHLSASVSWTAPNDGGSPITGYTVTTGSISTNTTATSITVTGLTNGDSYTFTVVAINAIGTSASATSNAVTPTNIIFPAPANVIATPGEGTVTVSWEAVSGRGSYIVTTMPGGATTSTFDTSAVIGDLQNGTEYQFSVHAVAGDFLGAESAPVTATPYTTPGAPVLVSGTPGDGQIQLAWTAPASDGGRAITGYTVYANPGALTQTTTDTSAAFTGLVNGRGYTFTVRATNLRGIGAESNTLDATPRVPRTAYGVTAVAGRRSVSVSWTAPSELPSSYSLTLSPGGRTTTVDRVQLQTGFYGLTVGTSYTVVVKANYPSGPGPDSEPSNAVEPTADVPSKPLDVAATASGTTVTVTWTAPTDNGGSPILGYTVRLQSGESVEAGPTETSASFTTSLGSITKATVWATNAIGAGAASDPSNEVSVAVPPGPMRDLTVTPAQNGGLNITCYNPLDHGGSQITGYVLNVYSSALVLLHTEELSSPFLQNYDPGTTDLVRIGMAAVNVAGVGEEIISDPVAVYGVPSAPTNVIARGYDGQVFLKWTAPTSNGGVAINHYIVTNLFDGTTTDSGGSLPQALVSGLPNATNAYSFTVAAVTSIGTGEASEPSNAVVPASATDLPAPTQVHAAASAHVVTVTWVAPAVPSPLTLTGFQVTSSDGQTTLVDASTTTASFTMADGYFVFFVTAVADFNGATAMSTDGRSPALPVSDEVVTNVIAVAGDGQATISWDHPVSDGGDQVLIYNISGTPDGFTQVLASQSSTVITGLTNGVVYRFTVSAVHLSGAYGKAVPSNSVVIGP